MLPFLKAAKKQTGVIVTSMSADGHKEEQSNSEQNPGLTACAHDLITAIHSKDSKAVADILQAAFEIMESRPHEEGPHTFDSMNQKAGRVE